MLLIEANLLVLLETVPPFYGNRSCIVPSNLHVSVRGRYIAALTG